ncbi:MAG: glycosyltransferase [Phycisphaerales bacterium]
MPSNNGTTPPAIAAPPAWPRTAAPRRIAFLGWARLSAQWREGSGYNLSASELAAGLALSGHSVFALRSGMDYSPLPGMRIRPHETWRGIQCFRLVNSPNLAPAVFNFTNMASETACPQQCRVITRWLDEVGAEIVHVHSLEGYPMDIVAAIRATGRPVVVTPHNYHYVCPQVDLLRHENGVCLDYDGGRACVGCLRPAPPWKARLRRRFEQSIATIFGKGVAAIVRNEILEPANHAKRVAGDPTAPSRGLDSGGSNGSAKPRRGRRAAELASSPPDPELALGFESVEPDPSHPGLIQHNLTLDADETWAQPQACEPDTNERFLASTHHLTVLNEYGTRRAAGAAALTAASLVTPPSRFMGRVYESMGVPTERIRHVRLGQPHFDQINRRARRSPTYDTVPWAPSDERPLRLAFLGTTRANKGVAVLAAAIPLLPHAIRRRCQIIIRASGETWALRKALSAYPEVTFQGPFDPISLIAAGADYDVGLLPFVWFENSPLVLLEHLHAGKFVISSRLGGPPEWVVEPDRAAGTPGNGLLFPGGRPDALATCIQRIVTGEVGLPTPREVHGASALWSYPAHVAEVESVYQDLLGREKSAQASAGGQAPANASPPASNGSVVEAAPSRPSEAVR